MTQIVSFEDYTPPARFDDIPWSDVVVEESDTSTLSDATIWTEIDDIALSPLDVDPATPQTRSFTTAQASDTPDLWYRVTFKDGGGNVSLTSTPIQNLEFPAAAYATASELFRILKINSPTPAQEGAAQGDLDAATIEINSFIDWSDDHAPATPEQLELLRGVCLDRAADLWRHRESAAGILGITDEVVQAGTGRYSFARYTSRLTRLKDRWGIA